MSVEDIEHCLVKIEEIVTRGTDDRRSLLQLGYNLGRLSELTGLGRQPFWDAWKGPVEMWDRAGLLRSAGARCAVIQTEGPEGP